jgi:hypothetical protein
MYECKFKNIVTADNYPRPRFVHEPLTFAELEQLYASGGA